MTCSALPILARCFACGRLPFCLIFDLEDMRPRSEGGPRIYNAHLEAPRVEEKVVGGHRIYVVKDPGGQ